MDTAFKATGVVMEKKIVLMDLMSKDAVSIDDLCKVKQCFLYIVINSIRIVKNSNYIPGLL